MCDCLIFDIFFVIFLLPRAFDRRILLIAGISILSSYFHTFSHIFSSSDLLIFTSSHLHIFSSPHLLIFTPSYLHICSSSYLLIFPLHTFSSSHLLSYLLIFPSAHLHTFSSSYLLIFISFLLSLSLFSLPFLSLVFFIFLSLG